MAVCIVTGTPFLKWNTTMGRVLYVNLEIPRPFMRRRLGVLTKAKGLLNVENLDVWTLRGQDLDAEALLNAIIDKANTGHYSLIILDPIYKLMVGRSENMASGVGAMVRQIDQLVEKTGAAVAYAHHFTKGNAAKKRAIDRMSGSGVFARDADTIMTLTEHQEEGCYTVEMTLRNFPPQAPFVVEWKYPVMVERLDLDPKNLRREQGDNADDDLNPMLKLLDEKPRTTGEWKKAAEAEGYPHATFFRYLAELRAAKRVQRDRKEKTWSLATVKPDSNANGATLDTGETDDTFDTFETAEMCNPNGHEVSSLKSINTLNTDNK